MRELVAAALMGALVANKPNAAITLGLVPLALLLLASPLARLLVVSFGALLTFQSSSDVSTLKSVYLLCFLVALVGTLASLARDGSAMWSRPTSRLAAGCACAP